MKMPIRRHFSVLFLITLLLATFAVPSFATEPGASSAALHWFDDDGRPMWVHPFKIESSPASTSQNPVPLQAERWVDSMSALSFPTLEGGVVDLAQIEAPATILDFWATWCAPCRQELPHLEQMYERLKDRGLVAWAINAEESVPVIRSFVRELGLNLPIGRYTSSLDEQVAIRTLPTVLLLDREGRVRKRWDGYVRGLEAQIAAEILTRWRAECPAV
jgi:thiol-disulfide isomerase/thioredoxin